MYAAHDDLELCVHFVFRPSEALAVLAHFQTADRNAARVDRLGGRDDDAVFLQVGESIVGGGHIGDLVEVTDAHLDHRLGVLDADFVLHGAGHVNIGLDIAPGLLARDEFAAELVGIILDDIPAACAHLEHIVDLLALDAVGVVDVSVGAGEGEDLAAQLGDLERRAPCDIAEAGEAEGLAFDVFALVREHFPEEVGCAEARRLGTDERAAVCKPFARQHAVVERAADFLVRTEEVADFSAAHAHVARGDIDIGPDVTVKLGHEAVAEAHDFRVGFACGVKVAAALAAAHGKPREGVLEGLLEGEELHDGEVDIGLEAQAALVGSDGVVELDPETAVDMVDALVVRPRHAENDLSVGLDHAFEDAVFPQNLFVLRDCRCKRFQHFTHGLHEFGFVRIFAFCRFYNFGNVGHSSSLAARCGSPLRI